MSEEIQGIIVACESSIGLILLKPSSTRSMEELAAQYASSKSKKKFWMAGFTLDAVRQSSSKPGTTPTKTRRGHRSLIGRQVVCTVKKAKHWTATSVRIVWKTPRYAVITEPKGRKAASGGHVSRSVLDGNRGDGVVFAPIGTRKPGSHRSD